MTHWVEVIGSMDQVFVGPFATKLAADGFAEAQRGAKPQFDFSVMDDAEKAASVAEHGDLPVNSPDAFVEGDE